MLMAHVSALQMDRLEFSSIKEPWWLFMAVRCLYRMTALDMSLRGLMKTFLTRCFFKLCAG